MAGKRKLLEPIHPGEILFEDFMKPMEVSINRLARDTAVPPGRISAIVNGKAPLAPTPPCALANTLVFRPRCGWGAGRLRPAPGAA